jgi:uncharacterized repeat protein (TIGR01451 family)
VKFRKSSQLVCRRLGQILALISAGAIWATPAGAATYDIIASRDSYLSSTSVNANFGTASELRMITTPASSFRDVLYFDLSAIPAGEAVVSATLRVFVTDGSPATVTIHRITDGWTETGVTWANTAADFDPTASGSFVPAHAFETTSAITGLVQAWRSGTPNHGMMLIAANLNNETRIRSREGPTGQRPRLTVVTTAAPNFTMVKTSQAISDPLNGVTNPYRIPGGTVRYTIVVANTAPGRPDANSVVITEPVPNNTKLFVGDLGGASSGPVLFTNGTPSSTLTYTYLGLGNPSDSISFSNNGGASYGYAPSADVDGCDPAVTHFRVNPAGTFAGNTGGGSPSFNLQLQVVVQ